MITRIPIFAAMLVSAGTAIAIPVATEIPASGINLSASNTFSPAQDPLNLINNSGLQGDRHDNESGARTMWHTGENPAAITVAGRQYPAWVRFDFKSPQAVNELRIWNHNQAGLTDRGFRKTKVLGSADGITWVTMAETELKQGGDNPQTLTLAARHPLKAIIIAAESNFGSACYGLSEVKFINVNEVAADAIPFPDGVECQAGKIYRHRPDGQPGREITLTFTGGKLYGEADADIAVAGLSNETVHLKAAPGGSATTTVLLPPGAAVDREAQLTVTVRSGNRAVRAATMVPPQRQWTVFLLPHSHVDIGYTNTQDNVEFIHRRNLTEAIKLAKATANYPAGARFKWDTEVAWPAERTLVNGTDEDKKALLDAIQQGLVNVGASYINDNTSVSADEEFAAFFGPSETIGKLTGKKFDTVMQVDVPGMSWGVVSAAAQHGIPYVFLFNNGSDRTGHSMDLSHRPFWWIGPDGTSKVLCYQPGSYAPCAQLKGMPHAMQIMGQTDRTKIPAAIHTSDPRANFVDAIHGHFADTRRPAPNVGYLWKCLETLEHDPLYPYDLFSMSWALADNTPVDADLPDAVKSWNEEYAFPKLVIATSHDIMTTFDRKFGNQIPTRTGEFTEYWSDGLGSAAKQTSMNRHAKERLIQTDTLWSMLDSKQPAPRAALNEAWRNVLLGSEHTWCYAVPNQQPMQNEIMKVKFGYFQQAHDDSVTLLNETLKPITTPESKTIAVFNTLSWSRTGLVTLPDGVSFLKDTSTQKLSSGESVFLATEVPALGVRNYPISPIASNRPSSLIVTPTTLDNGLVKVTLDPDTGDITSLVGNGIEYARGPINSYHYLIGGDAADKATGPSEVKLSIKENGPVLASIMVESKAAGCNWLKREIRLLTGQAQVEIINTLDKLAITRKEGVHFGFAFDIPHPRTRIDIPWGIAEVDADFFPEANRNWICFQRWLDISNHERGVTWCSLDAPTFEHGAITANILGGATNSPAWIRKLQPSATIYSWALNNHWHTNFPLSQAGVLTFRYAILPHNAAYDAAAANRFGLEQARPLLATPVKQARDLTPRVVVDNPKVFVSILKRSDDGKASILRLRSVSGQPEAVNLSWPAATPKSIRRSDATEAPGDPASGTFTLPPSGVITLRVEF